MCVCVYVVYTCVFTGVHANACGSLRTTLGVKSSGTIHRFWARVSHRSGTHQAGLTDWPASPRHPIVPAVPVLGLQVSATIPYISGDGAMS